VYVCTHRWAACARLGGATSPPFQRATGFAARSARSARKAFQRWCVRFSVCATKVCSRTMVLRVCVCLCECVCVHFCVSVVKCGCGYACGGESNAPCFRSAPSYLSLQRLSTVHIPLFAVNVYGPHTSLFSDCLWSTYLSLQ